MQTTDRSHVSVLGPNRKNPKAVLYVVDGEDHFLSLDLNKCQLEALIKSAANVLDRWNWGGYQVDNERPTYSNAGINIDNETRLFERALQTGGLL